MKTIIFLDDERSPIDVTWIDYRHLFGKCKFKVVNNSKDFRYQLYSRHIRNSLQDVVFSFDHDIQCFDDNGLEDTGYDCLKMLIDLCLHGGIKIPECVFHTKNIVGKANMEAYYQNALKFEGEQNV